MEERGGRGGIEGERRMEGRVGEAAQESAAVRVAETIKKSQMGTGGGGGCWRGGRGPRSAGGEGSVKWRGGG